MSGRSPAHWTRGISGRNALSRWSWLLTLPFALSVMNMFAQPDVQANVASGTAVIFLVHVLLGLAGILLRRLVAAPASPEGRMVAALGAFAFLGACRPPLVAWFAQALDVADLGENLWARILINIVAALVLLPVIAILTDSIRGHAVLERRLRAARAAIEIQLGFDEDRLRSIRSNYVNELSGRLDAALTARTTTALDRSGAARLLRTLADEVVRPMSHQLFHDRTPWPYQADPPRPPTRAERALGLLRLVRPAPVALPVMLFALLIAVRLLAEYGVLFLLVQWVVGGAILLAGNIVAALTTRRITGPVRRISAMTLCYAAATTVSASVTCLLLGMFGYVPVFYWSALWAYPLTALTVAVLRAAERQRRRHEVRLAGSFNEQLKLADRAHQRLLHTRRRIARVLHTHLQGTLVSSALALSASERGHADEDPGPQCVRDILTRAMAEVQDEILAGSPGHAGGAASRIEDLLDTWGRVLKLSCDIDPETWALCDEDPARAEAVIDVLSEGFTNAIRHGERNQVRVSMSALPDESNAANLAAGTVHISISSPGRLRPHDRPSLGMTTLQALSKEVTLKEEGESVVLRVVLA